MYHERQALWRCGLHALNNLLQEPAFDQAALDAASQQLLAMSPTGPPSALSAWLWNPHRAPLGVGLYDVNVLIYVLQERGFEVKWIDKRQPVTLETVDFEAIEGVLCNVMLSGAWLRAMWENRHWFAIRKIEGVCYNLDSKLPEPARFDSDDKCRTFVQELLETGECEVLLVSKKPSADGDD